MIGQNLESEVYIYKIFTTEYYCMYAWKFQNLYILTFGNSNSPTKQK